MDIGNLIDIISENSGLVIAIAVTTTFLEATINLLINKVFLQPFITRWGSKYSRKIVPYVISKLEPIAPDLMKDWSPAEIEKKLFEEIINAPGSPEWSNKKVLSKKERKEIRKIYSDLIREFDFVKASNRCRR
jgi:hypothetical protein